MLVAHLSDPHITTGPLASEPAFGLHRALGRVLAVDPVPDLVVLTGDLVERGSAEEYAAFREIVGSFPLPLYLAAGNHDDRTEFLAALGGSTHLAGGTRARFVADHDGVSVVVLDSLHTGQASGRLGADQLSWLDGVLTERPEQAVFVCLHHPPVDVGIPILDGMRLIDGDELGAVISRHPQVVRVLAGHVHRPVTTAFANTTLTIAPSTYRITGLGLRADRMLGFRDEPTSFLLHVGTAAGWVTHSVPISHAGGQTDLY